MPPDMRVQHGPALARRFVCHESRTYGGAWGLSGNAYPMPQIIYLHNGKATLPASVPVTTVQTVYNEGNATTNWMPIVTQVPSVSYPNAVGAPLGFPAHPAITSAHLASDSWNWNANDDSES